MNTETKIVTIHSRDPEYWGSDETEETVADAVITLRAVFDACGFTHSGRVAGSIDEEIYLLPQDPEMHAGGSYSLTDDETGEPLESLNWWEWWCGEGYRLMNDPTALLAAFREAMTLPPCLEIAMRAASSREG